MKGRIHAESSLGEGSTFFVELPFGVTELHQAASAALQPEVEQAPRILLVEDNPDDAILTRRALEKSEVSHRVEVARDGLEALGAGLAQGRAFGKPDASFAPSIL